MPRIIGTWYVLAVHDVVRAAGWYHDVLRFRIGSVEAGGWAFLERDGCRLMLGECPGALPPHDLGDHSYFGYLVVDDVDAEYAAVTEAGGACRAPPGDRPWGMREFHLHTPDGHRITVGQDLEVTGAPPPEDA